MSIIESVFFTDIQIYGVLVMVVFVEDSLKKPNRIRIETLNSFKMRFLYLS